MAPWVSNDTGESTVRDENCQRGDIMLSARQVEVDDPSSGCQLSFSFLLLVLLDTWTSSCYFTPRVSLYEMDLAFGEENFERYLREMIFSWENDADEEFCKCLAHPVHGF